MPKTPLQPPIRGPFPLPIELPWAVSRAECLSCETTWVAAHPVDAGDLECQRCGSTDTLRFEPEDAEQA